MISRMLAISAAVALAVAGSGADLAAKNVKLKFSYWVPPPHKLTPGYKD